MGVELFNVAALCDSCFLLTAAQAAKGADGIGAPVTLRLPEPVTTGLGGADTALECHARVKAELHSMSSPGDKKTPNRCLTANRLLFTCRRT